MREILFKAKRIDNGEWVEGFYDCLTANYEPRNVHYIQCFKKLENGQIIWTERFEVIPETVCQYTGVEDNDGKKIFEMDILKHTFTKWEDCEEIRYSKNYFVKWYSSMTNCGYRYKNKRNIFPFKEGTVWSGKDIVIGNMHDNPELLDGDV